MVKRLAGLVATGTAFVACLAASTAGAGNNNNSFLCYSKTQVDPEPWAISDPNTGNTDATHLLAAGYWLPYAEKSVPTGTQLPGGWYLICNLKSTEAAVTGGVVGGAGEMITDPTLGGLPGYYPEAT